MKAIFFKNGIEFNVQTRGETWEQGGRISGTVSVKNINTAPVTLDNLNANLAFGTIRNVRARNEQSWNIALTSSLCAKETLNPGDVKTFSWDFPLATDCPVTVKDSSLFFLLGDVTNPESIGHLQLDVQLRPMLRQFLETFELFYRFTIAATKNRKNFVEVKMIPPKTRTYGFLEALNCTLRLQKDVMEIKYEASIKTISTSLGPTIFEKGRRQFAQELPSKEFQLGPGIPNPEGLKKAIELAIAEIRPKPVL
jgi:sporulation-control protein spo0M